MVLTNALLLAGGAALVAAVRRSHRLAAIVGCGCVAAAALAFAHQRASAGVAAVGVSQGELSQGRQAYFERVIARKLAASRPPMTSALSHEENVRWFRRARLGLFVHYGPTSLFAAPTDRRWWEALDAGEFVRAAGQFRPHHQAVTEWVALAKRLGASYITVTAKHHDGFGLWDSALTRWDVGPRADLIRPLARACRRNGLRLFIYYSLLDRHEPTYATDKDAYLVYVEGQLRELLTRNGPVAGVWFDGWNREFGVNRLEHLYRLVHTLQPWALVGTNHHRRVLFRGEDFRIFENVFPSVRTSRTPREIAVKLGPTWFWGGPRAPARLDRLASLLARAAPYHANLLADLPPRPDGTFDPAVLAGAD